MRCPACTLPLAFMFIPYYICARSLACTITRASYVRAPARLCVRACTRTALHKMPAHMPKKLDMVSQPSVLSSLHEL